MHTRARKRSRSTARKRYAKLLRRWEASQYLLEVHGLQVAPGTLAKKACLGTGPEICFVNGIPFYRPTGLDVWTKALIGKPTTRARKDTHHRNRSASRQSRQSRQLQMRTGEGDPSPASTASTETPDLQPLPPWRPYLICGVTELIRGAGGAACRKWSTSIRTMRCSASGLAPPIAHSSAHGRRSVEGAWVRHNGRARFGPA